MMRRLLAALVVAAVAAAAPAAAALVVTRPIDAERYTILVMGSDMGPWRAESVLDGRSDALHLVSVVPGERSAAILSFPRDLYVSVPGRGTDRINAALTRGPETAVETVEQLTGVEVDAWIVTGMGAFVRGVNDFGGLQVNVPQRLSIDDRTVQAGDQLLDGHDTLVFARDRKNRSDGDFGRNRAQAEVLTLLHREVIARDPSLRELTELVTTLRRTTVSSLSTADTLRLAGTALRIDPALVELRQVPGSLATRGGASVVVPTGAADTLFADLRDDGLFTP